MPTKIRAQSRLKVGFRTALRGRDNALSFQSGGRSLCWFRADHGAARSHSSLDAHARRAAREKYALLGCGHVNCLMQTYKEDDEEEVLVWDVLELSAGGHAEWMLEQLTIAARHGHCNVFHFLMQDEQHATVLTQQVHYSQRRVAHLPMITFMLAEVMRRCGDPPPHAQQWGLVLQWFIDLVGRSNVIMHLAAAASGAPVALQSFGQPDMLGDPDIPTLQCLAGSGNPGMFRVFAHDAMVAAANAVVWAKRGPVDTRKAIARAAASAVTRPIPGDLSSKSASALRMMEMFLAQHETYKFISPRGIDTSVVDHAVRAGNRDVLAWLHATFPDVQCGTPALLWSVENGDIAVVEFLHQHGLWKGAHLKSKTIERATERSANQIGEVIAYVDCHDLSPPITDTAIASAATTHQVCQDLLLYFARRYADMPVWEGAMGQVAHDQQATDALSTVAGRARYERMERQQQTQRARALREIEVGPLRSGERPRRY